MYSRSLKFLDSYRSIIGVAIFCSASAAYAAGGPASGSLDVTFDVDGKVNTDFGYSESAGGVVIQADGKMIAAGQGNVARYNADGSLDSSFGVGGKVFIPIHSNNLALQSDGKIIVAGSAVVRLNSNGSLDNTFGTSGQANIPIYGDDVAIQSDGKIVLSSDGGFTVVRLNSDGTLDNTFGSSGLVGIALDGDAKGIAVQGSNLVITGRVYKAATAYDFVVVRLTSNGSLDSSFGTAGIVITSTSSGYDWGEDLVVQADGKIVVAGFSNYDFALVRYNSNGTLDSTFGNGGIAPVIDFDRRYDSANSIALQADGKIVTAGTAAYTSNVKGMYDYRFAVARYNANGTVDTRFGSQGKVTFNLFDNVTDSATSVAIQSDGKIVVAGGTTAPTTAEDFAVARLNP